MNNKLFFARYRNILTGTSNAPTELTAEEHLEWEAFMHKTGEQFLALRDELKTISDKLQEEYSLPGNINDWDTADFIIYLQAIDGEWYESIMRKGLLQFDNAVDLLDAVEARLGN